MKPLTDADKKIGQMARQRKQLEKQIEAAWYRQASGVQVDLMSIPRIFDEAYDAVRGGQVLEDVITKLIAKYRVN